MSKGHHERRVARSVKKQEKRQERQRLLDHRRAEKRRLEMAKLKAGAEQVEVFT